MLSDAKQTVKNHSGISQAHSLQKITLRAKRLTSTDTKMNDLFLDAQDDDPERSLRLTFYCGFFIHKKKGAMVVLKKKTEGEDDSVSTK